MNNRKSDIHPALQETLEAEGGWMRVSGYSMFPRFLPGQSVEIEKVNLEELKLGDIVAIKGQQFFQLHRLIRPLQEGKFQTAGDFTRTADMPLDQNCLLGRVASPQGFIKKIIESVMKQITLWRYF